MSHETIIVAEVKDNDPNPDLESDPENIENSQIIDIDPTATIATVTIQTKEPVDPEEGEHLFHSHMWVKGTPLHLIVDSRNQKNLISSEVIKHLGLSTTPHQQLYNIGWLHQEEISVSASSVTYPMESIASRMR
jgi:hypothetical protein